MEYLNDTGINGAFPDYNKVLRGMFSQGDTYTPTENCFLFAITVGDNSSINVSIAGKVQYKIGGNFSHYHEDDTILIPVAKGNTISADVMTGNCGMAVYGTG